MAARIAAQTRCAVAVPNYRLTPSSPTDDSSLHHPAHAEDVLRALIHLRDWTDPSYDATRIYVMGHSCGAHILASIFLDSAAVSPSLTPPASLLAALRAIVVSEGIYDLDLLVANFPSYRAWFIANTFGERDSYSAFSTTTFPMRSHGEHIRWLIIHSKGDTLVDLPQSHSFYEHLCSLYRTLGRPIADVLCDSDTLTQEHNDVLRTEAFTHMVTEYILVDINSLS